MKRRLLSLGPISVFLFTSLSCSAMNGIAPRTEGIAGPTIRPAQGTLAPAAPSATWTPDPTFTPSKTATSTRTATRTPLGVYPLMIPADIVWFNTKIVLQAGEYMTIDATGRSNISGVPDHDIWGPDGDSGNCPSDCLMPGVGYGTLIGKLTGGLPFKVGSFYAATIQSDGTLLLAINDNEPYYFDNSGSYTVKVQVWQSPP